MPGYLISTTLVPGNEADAHTTSAGRQLEDISERGGGGGIAACEVRRAGGGRKRAPLTAKSLLKKVSPCSLLVVKKRCVFVRFPFMSDKI